MNHRKALVARFHGRLRTAAACEELVAGLTERLARAPGGSEEEHFFSARLFAAMADRDHARAIARHYRDQAKEMSPRG